MTLVSSVMLICGHSLGSSLQLTTFTLAGPLREHLGWRSLVQQGVDIHRV